MRRIRHGAPTRVVHPLPEASQRCGHRGQRDAWWRGAPHPRGFALLAVLWAMVGMIALGAAIALVARHTVAAAQNRKNLLRAAWSASACVARARVAIDEVLAGGGPVSVPRGAGWRALDSAVATAPLVAASACDVSLRAAGARIDVNHADPDLLGALCARLGIPDARADSLVDALLDWRDADDVPRPFGAERAWYAAGQRHLPRNGPLADRRELLLVRGFSSMPALDSLLDVEPGRIDLGHAPLAVIGALPGFSDEVVSRVAERRLRGAPLTDLSALGGELSPTARQQLLAHYAELIQLTTTAPDAWMLTSRAHTGSPAVTAVVEVRLVLAGRRAAIVRRRTWVE